ncbi:MAG TPA: toast rack family protein [Candidatus Acidoferrales bacterium]
MAKDRHRPSIAGGLIVVTVGIIFLIANLQPDLDIWSVAMRYWPVILIVIGLGKIFDAFRIRADAPAPGAPANSDLGNNLGLGIAMLVLIGFVVFAVLGGHGGRVKSLEASQSVELQGAKTVNATIDLPSGTLDLAGGAPRLLDADFKFRERDGQPIANYTVNHDEGSLDISQENKSHVHLAGSGNDWRLRFADAIPLDLTVNIGAGKANLDLRNLAVTDADLKVGAGHLDLDLTGPRKSDLHVNIRGGVGTADIRVPRDIGVRLHASDGLGDVNAHGFHHDGDDYTNDAVGKSPQTISIDVSGGVGQITLEQQGSASY